VEVMNLILTFIFLAVILYIFTGIAESLDNVTGDTGTGVDTQVTTRIKPHNVYIKNIDFTPAINHDVIIENLFKSISESVPPSGNGTTTEIDYKSSFQQFSSAAKFPWNDRIKDFLLFQINSVLGTDPNYTGTEWVFTRDIFNIYWKDFANSGTRHLVFNIFITNPRLSISKKIRVYLVVNNLSRYITDRGDFNPFSPVNAGDLRIVYITLDEYKSPLVVDALDKQSLSDSTYYIKNRLGLMDPFRTSGKEMEIDEEMKTKFGDVLLEKAALKKRGDVTVYGYCFNSDSPGAITQEECVKSNGVWDTPPKTDADCAYNRANTNYPNSFGKITNWNCQFPVGMKRIGFRYYSNQPENLPLCYNCKTNTIGKGTLGNCCNEQRDKTVYPMLTSPDYAFPDDRELRTKYSDIFESVGLSTT